MIGRCEGRACVAAGEIGAALYECTAKIMLKLINNGSSNHNNLMCRWIGIVNISTEHVVVLNYNSRLFNPYSSENLSFILVTFCCIQDKAVDFNMSIVCGPSTGRHCAAKHAAAFL